MNEAKDRAPGWWAVVGSLLLAVAAAVYLLTAPAYSSVSTTSAGGAAGPVAPVVSRGEATLLEVNGWSVLVPMLFPVILSAIPLCFVERGVARAARFAVGGLLMGFVVVAGFSIGMAYLPSAVAMLLAAGWIDASRVVRTALEGRAVAK